MSAPAVAPALTPAQRRHLRHRAEAMWLISCTAFTAFWVSGVAVVVFLYNAAGTLPVCSAGFATFLCWIGTGTAKDMHLDLLNGETRRVGISPGGEDNEWEAGNN